MCPSPSHEDIDKAPSRAQVETHGRELTDLFRALVRTNTADAGISGNDLLISFEVLAAAEQLLKAYFRPARVGVAVLDSSFRYLAVNQVLAEMNGVSSEQHVGKSVRDVLGALADLVEPQLKRVFASAQPVLYFEISSALPGRTTPGYWVEHIVPIHDEKGKVAQVGVLVVEVTEQKQLEESLRSVSQTLRYEKKRLQVMSEVTRALATKLDVQKVFPKISAYLRRVLRQEYAALALRDEKSGRLAQRAMDFPLQKALTAAEIEIDAAKDPWGKALSDRAPVILNKDQMKEFSAGTVDHLLAEGLQSLCCVPLLRPGGGLGVIVLGSTRANAFQIEDLALVSQVAAQLAIAVENARTSREFFQLRNRLQKEKKYLEGEVSPALNFEGIIGESQALKDVLNQVSIVAASGRHGFDFGRNRYREGNDCPRHSPDQHA